MKKTYTTSTQTAKYLDAVLLLREGNSLALEAAEDIYGNLNSPTGDEIVKPFQTKINEAIDELFKLIQGSIENNLGDVNNSRQENVTI